MPELEFEPTKLQALLHFIVASLDRELGSIELAKFVYLTDIEKTRLLGETVTGEDYYWADFGPLATEFQSSLSQMLDHEIVRTIGTSGGFTGMPKFCHRPGSDPRFEPDLDKFDYAIASRVLKKYGHLSPVALERAAHETEPMQAEGLDRGDILEFELVERDARYRRWKKNLQSQDWKDDQYQELLSMEQKEVDEILNSIS